MMQCLRRRLEKNNLGFSHVFSANLSYILSNKIYGEFPIYYIKQIIAQIRQKMQRKTHRKFPIYYIRQIIA